MRTTCFGLFILLHCLSASGSERVTVQKPLMTVVTSEQQLREICGGDGKYDACTRFVAFRLNASCSADGSGWRASGAATFRPFIVLLNMRSLSHEHEHIEDLRGALDLLVVGLEGEQFPTEEGCRSRVALEAGSFETTLRRFALESNLARHPQLRAERRAGRN